MEFDHDVPIANILLDEEATSVIGVHLDDGILIDVDLSGQDVGEDGVRGFSRRYFDRDGLGRLGFSGEDSLGGLDHSGNYLAALEKVSPGHVV